MCLFAVGIGLLLAASGHAAGERPLWSRHAISDLPATNTVAQPDESRPMHPARIDLERLTQPNDSAPDAWRPAEDRRIAEFGDYRPVDEMGADERLEQSRVNRLLEDADALVRHGDSDGATSLLEEALTDVRHDVSRFMLHRRLGAIAFRSQDYTLAERHMADALSLDPGNAGMASNLAAAQISLGALDEALQTLQTIQLGLVQNRHLLFSVHFNLACVYSMKSRNEEALQHLFAAAEQDAPATFASLGDTQLDGIRRELRFRDLQLALESMLRER